MTTPTPATNRSLIQENRKKIFELEQAVMNNKKDALITRSAILENRDLIQRKYPLVYLQSNHSDITCNTRSNATY